MHKVKIFSKSETISLIVIFIILTTISIPNFAASLRRSRDQVRRDDMGSLMGAIGQYQIDFGVYPPSSEDGRIVDCLKPGDAPYKDEKGFWVINSIPCVWGQDAFANLLTKREYMTVLPRDPDWQKGASYRYISDGDRYQLFASMEGGNEPEVDARIVAEGLGCGTRICNIGRSVNCDIPKTLRQCEEEDAARLLKK